MPDSLKKITLWDIIFPIYLNQNLTPGETPIFKLGVNSEIQGAFAERELRDSDASIEMALVLPTSATA